MAIIRKVTCKCNRCGKKVKREIGVSPGDTQTVYPIDACAECKERDYYAMKEKQDHVDKNWKTCNCDDCQRRRRLWNKPIGG